MKKKILIQLCSGIFIITPAYSQDILFVQNGNSITSTNMQVEPVDSDEMPEIRIYSAETKTFVKPKIEYIQPKEIEILSNQNSKKEIENKSSSKGKNSFVTSDNDENLPQIRYVGPSSPDKNQVSAEIEFSNVPEGTQTLEIEFSNNNFETSNKIEESPPTEEMILFKKSDVVEKEAKKDIQENKKEDIITQNPTPSTVVKHTEIVSLIFNDFYQLDTYVFLNGNSILVKEEDLLLDLAELAESFDYQNFLLEIDGVRYLNIPFSYMKREKNIYNITIPEKYFKKSSYNIKKQIKEAPLAQRTSALYGNYVVTSSFDDKDSLSASVDVNYINKKGQLLENKFIYKGDEKEVLRDKTSFTMIDDDNKKITIGDVTSGTLLNQSSINMLGLRLSTPYYHNRNSLDGLIPSVNVNGFSVNPTQMDILFNNIPYDRVKLGSGLYDLNIPLNMLNGNGTISTITYDSVGNPIRVDIPAFRNNKIVAKGSLEYDVSIGAARKNAYQDSFDYSGGAVLTAVGLYGLTDRLSSEFLGQFSEEGSILLANASYYPNENIGLITLKGGINDEGQSLIGFDYNKGDRKFNFNMNAEMAASDYFCYNFSNNCLKNQINIGLNYSLPRGFGRLGFLYNRRESYRKDINEERNVSSTSLTWNKRFNSNLDTSISLRNRKFTSHSDNGIYFTLNYNFDSNFSTNTKVDTSGDINKISQTLKLSEDRNNKSRGYGSITYFENSDSVSANYGANLDKLNYRLYTTQSKNINSTFGSVGGGFYYLPEEKEGGLSRKTSSNMAIVHVEEQDNSIPIKVNNNFEGYTNNKGNLVINASPNQNFKVDIDSNKLDVIYDISSLTSQVKAPTLGVFKVPLKAGGQIYQVKVNNVKEGAYFTLNNEDYVIDGRGYLDLGSEGKAQLVEDGKICELNFVRTQTVYSCIWKDFKIDNNDNIETIEKEEEILFKK